LISATITEFNNTNGTKYAFVDLQSQQFMGRLGQSSEGLHPSGKGYQLIASQLPQIRSDDSTYTVKEPSEKETTSTPLLGSDNYFDIAPDMIGSYLKKLDEVPVSGSNYGTDSFLFGNKELISGLQKVLGLQQTGIADPKLTQCIKDMLVKEKITGYTPSTGDTLTSRDVGALQYSLRKSGDYPPGYDPADRIDCKFGGHTQAALIKRLQRLSPDLHISLGPGASSSLIPPSPSAPDRGALRRIDIPAPQTGTSIPNEEVLLQFAGPNKDTRNLRAFLDMIAATEGTTRVVNSRNNGYDVIVGGRTINDYNNHPKTSVYISSIKNYSNAAGRYQIMGFTFDNYKSRLGLSDFSPASQDAIALQLIKDNGALQDVLDGNTTTAINKLRKVWASFPGAGYAGQNGPGLGYMINVYNGSRPLSA